MTFFALTISSKLLKRSWRPACTLGGLLNQDAFGIFHNRAFMEEDGDVLLEGMEEEYILIVEGVARVHPLEVLGQISAEGNLAQERILLLPLGLLLHKDIDAMVHV